MFFHGSFRRWQPYVPVAERRRKAARAMARLTKKGQSVSPVVIQGRTIARTFWGKAWCDNLERYSDFENRLPRGRTYVRNGSVVDLQISPGMVKAHVSGSRLYSVTLKIATVRRSRWNAVCRECAGEIDSLVELLQGRLSKGVMERICRPQTGLFPLRNEIRFSCSCPDWAVMCKHVAAVLYGVGARLDEQPELLFVLRKVDEKQLIARAGRRVSLKRTAPSDKVLPEEGLSELFGLDLAGGSTVPAAAARPRQSHGRGVAARSARPKPERKAPAKLGGGPATRPGEKKTRSRAPAEKPANGRVARKATGKKVTSVRKETGREARSASVRKKKAAKRSAGRKFVD